MNRFACLMSLTFARAPLVLAAALCSIANVFAPAPAWVAAAVTRCDCDCFCHNFSL